MTLSGTITNFDSDSDIYYQVVYFNFLASDGTSPMFLSNGCGKCCYTGQM